MSLESRYKVIVICNKACVRIKSLYSRLDKLFEYVSAVIDYFGLASMCTTCAFSLVVNSR